MFRKDRLVGYLCVFLLVLVFMTGCAPKKVKIYDYDQDSRLRNNIIRTAIDLHGKPYRNGAKGPDAFDCSGFIYYVFKRWGVILPKNTEGLMRIGYEVKRNNIRPGDIIIFKVKKELHSGIVLNKNEFIHSSKSKGVGIDNIDNAYWRQYIIGYRSVI